MLNICSRKTAHEFSKSDFQGQFVGINSVIFHLYLKKNSNNDFKFLGKKKATTKVLLTTLVKLCTMYYAYKLVVCIRLSSKQRYNTIKKCMYIRTCRSLTKR